MPITMKNGVFTWTPPEFGDKEPIPTTGISKSKYVPETVYAEVPPEGGFRGTADPGFIDYLIGIAGGISSPSAYLGGIPGLGEEIGRKMFGSAQTTRGIGEAIGAFPGAVSEEIVGWSGLPPAVGPEDDILKYKTKMAAPVSFPEGKPIMDLPQEPVNLQAPTPGYVHLTDAKGNVIKDYTGTGGSYAPSKMEPGSSAFAMFGGPSRGEIEAQKYAAGQAQIEGQQAKTAQEQYLLEQAKQFGPQVLAGRPARPQMLEEIEGLASLRATRKQAVMPEAARAAQVNYEKANPGKSFATLSEENQQAIIDAEADRLLETGDYGRALKTWLSSKGLVGLGL